MWLATGAAWACGGFFCSGGGTTTTTTSLDYGLVPVEQSSERILFRVNPDDTVTTFVEVAYEQSADVDFAWIIPIPQPIDPSAVSTAGADLFNALELATAPRFTFEWTVTNYTYGSGTFGYYGDFDDGGGGCGLGCSGSSDGTYSDVTGTAASVGETTLQTQAAVEVVAEAVVGPFAIEVITATDAVEFAAWLDANGYDLPDGAVTPLEHYVGLGMAFLGVHLAPDAPEGPIDTLQFTYPATMPMIPIILTAIASVEQLPIQAYVLADDPYMPIGWQMTRDFTTEVLPDGSGGTDYLERVAAEVDRFDGKAFVLEYADETRLMEPLVDPEFDALVLERAWLTRWRGVIRPEQMTLDPEFVPEVGLQRYGNEHVVELDFAPGSTPRMKRSWLALPLVAFGWWRRRARR